MRKFLLRHKQGVLRILEFLPGFVSWNLILLPYWGIFVIPNTVAYFVLIFNIYWFYQSLIIAITSILSHIRTQASIKYDWVSDLKTFPDYQKLQHVVIVPTVKEPVHVVSRTLESLAKQSLPAKDFITVILATEAAVDKKWRTKRNQEIKKRFASKFKHFFITTHKLAPGEIIGKSSNERYAAIWAKKKMVNQMGMNIDYLTITSCDADHVYHPKYFACLAFKFMDNPNRYKHFWQGAVMFYNNIWQIPAITRVPTTFMTIWNLAQLSRRDRLLNTANYSLSFKLLDQAGYWDPDKVPEDWGIFFKAFYKTGGKIEVEPLFIPISVDAALSTTLFKTLKSTYNQIKRWAWGASDTPWIVFNYLTTKKISFWDKTTRLFTFLWAHLLWPVNWFIITIGLTLPTIINPAFGRTALGYTVPKLSSFVLTLALGFLVIMIIIDNIYKPKRPADFPRWRALLTPLEFVLMPISGFLFGALPGIDAHTRLMLGKYMEHRATEKV
jgi:cellulose synthase/poly-beta-1,6-N-acetylglucosamine synthase-like glycosyltransferase